MLGDDNSHYVIFIVNSWSFEFTSKLKQQGKHEKLKILKKVKSWHDVENVSRFGAHDEVHSTLVKRVAMAISWHDFRNPNLKSLLLQTESGHDFIKSCHDFWSSYCPFKLNCFQDQGLRIEKSKVWFWDLKMARRAISSTLYHFMYVLTPIMIMLFVNSIISS